MPANPVISITYLFTGIALFFLGIIIYQENPRQRLHRTTGLMLFFAALGALTGFGEMATPGAQTLARQYSPMIRILLIWELFFPLLLNFSLIFPKESKLITRYPQIEWLVFVPHASRFFLQLLFPTLADIRPYLLFDLPSGLLGILLRPLALLDTVVLALLSIFYDIQATFFALVNLLYVALAIFSMSASRRQITDSMLKKQIGLVVWGVRLSVGLFALAFLLPQLLPMHIAREVIYALTALAIILGAAAIIWAIVKYQFLSVRLVIRKGAVLFLTCVIPLGCYLLAYGQIQRPIISVFGVQVPVVETMFLFSALFFFQPLLGLINNAVDRIFHPNKKDYYQAMQELSRDVLTIRDFGQLQTKIIRGLTEILDVESVCFFLPDEKGDFCSILEASKETRAIRIDRDGELVRALSKKNQAIKSEQIRVQVSDREELTALEQLRSFLLAPIHCQDKLCAVLSIGRKRQGSFTSQDSALLDLFCSQISLTLENFRLNRIAQAQQTVEDELAVAREIQRMLLPRQNPTGKTFSLAALNIPSKEVGGDYHDFICLNGHQLGIAIGDISGKGIPGSILMSNLQASFRAAARSDSDPAQVMALVNHQMARTTGPEKYATFLYAVYDEELRTLRYCNAGHNYPVWKKRNGECELIKKGDPVIGIDESITYSEHLLQLSSGDMIIFYTDGITESLNAASAEYGENRLYQVISQNWQKGAAGLRDSIYEAVYAFAGGTSQYDDITLIVLSIL
jgi:sigma-B regulation protein RsbU (phosphoserine phosphatase)